MRRDPALFFTPTESRPSSVPRRSYAVITSNKGPASTAVRDQAIRLRGRPTAVGQALRFHPPKDAIELRIRNVKRVMVALELFRDTMEDAPGVCVVGKVDREMLVKRHLGEAPFRGFHREAEELDEELGRGAFVFRRNDQVVSCDCRGIPPSAGLVVTDHGLSEFLPSRGLHPGVPGGGVRDTRGQIHRRGRGQHHDSRMAHPYRPVDGTETARLDCSVSPDTRRGPSVLNTHGTSAPQTATCTLTGRTTA